MRSFITPSQKEIDSLMGAGVSIGALAMPAAMLVAVGNVRRDGLFDPDPAGHRWFAFDEFGSDDVVLWHQETNASARWFGSAFALGADAIETAATYSFDCALNIFRDPLDWLRSGRDGIVVLDWSLAFERLRHAPRIAIEESLLPTYRRHMRPARSPELFVIPERRQAA